MADDDMTPEQMQEKIMSVGQAMHQGAFLGLQQACLARQSTAMRYCTPGYSPYDDMVFPTKIARVNAATGKRSVRHTAEGGEEANYSGAPFDTGILRAGIYPYVVDGGTEITGGIGCGSIAQGPGTIPGYALYVHEGTSKMFARPFLRDACEDEEEDTRQRIAMAIQQAVGELSV
jgi:hypothetical protein